MTRVNFVVRRYAPFLKLSSQVTVEPNQVLDLSAIDERLLLYKMLTKEEALCVR